MIDHAKAMEEAQAHADRAAQAVERIKAKLEAGHPRSEDLKLRLLELEQATATAEFDRRIAAMKLAAEGKVNAIEVPTAELGVTSYGG